MPKADNNTDNKVDNQVYEPLMTRDNDLLSVTHMLEF